MQSQGAEYQTKFNNFVSILQQLKTERIEKCKNIDKISSKRINQNLSSFFLLPYFDCKFNLLLEIRASR